MNLLYKKNIPVVWFCIGQLIEARPEPLIEAIHRGFIIANHSYSHPAFSSISIEQSQEEIKRTDDLIDSLYQRAGVPRPAKWFRFPYGDKGDLKKGRVFNHWKRGDQKRKKTIQEQLAQLGYTQPAFEEVTYQFMRKADLYKDLDWAWTFDIMEWALLEKRSTQGLDSIEKIISRMKKNRPKDCRGFLGFEKRWLASPSAEVILLHDHVETTVYFEQIVEELKELVDFKTFFP